jgi:hypothetical protein
VRLQLVVAERKPYLLEAIVLACLRLGILPQVSNNRNAYIVQITEGVEQILSRTHRVKANPYRRVGTPRNASACARSAATL